MKKIVGVRLDLPILHAITDRMVEENISQSDVIRKALCEYLEVSA